MSNREEFEKIERVKDILSNYNWFFDSHSNQYVLESHSGDIGCLQASNYLDGLWYMWQARVPEGYVVVPVEPSDYMKCTVRDFGPDIEDYENMSKWDWEKLCAEIYKAMIEAVEK